MIRIGWRNGCGLRRQKWPTVGVVFVFALLGVMAISGQARAEVKVEKAVPVDSSAILEAALCVMKANPGQCVRQQAARVLTNWEDILNTKKIEMLAEADQEVTAKQQSRGLSDAEIARGKPSTLMEQIETGLTALTEFVSDGVDEYVDDKQQEKAVEEATSKTHLHHLLHKLGNAGNGSAQDGASVARAADDEDYRDQLAAVEDGLVDYAALAGGPDKALGRGKQEGDQADYGFGSGEHNAGNGGGSRSAIEGGRTAAGDGDGAELRQRHDATDEVGEARRAPAPAATVRFDDDIGELRRRRTHTNGRADLLLPYYVLSTLGPIMI
uniref:Uncharacterized protein n=1 Tax=Anopheles atroparvus TaxID=41427 RepID=A0A182IKT7_ANOAO